VLKPFGLDLRSWKEMLSSIMLRAADFLDRVIGALSCFSGLHIMQYRIEVENSVGDSMTVLHLLQ